VKTIALAIAGLLLVAAPSLARPQNPPAPDPTAPSPAEVQRLFDSFALVQAQQGMNLGDEQYAKFLPRFMALQNARRQATNQHNRVLNEIRMLLRPDAGGTDEQIKAALKQLQDIDDRGDTETRKAMDAIDQTLDLRQQARFRVFEEQMERRKLEFVTRARQANRANNPNRQPQPQPPGR
jgi:hypothetical protein